MMNLMFESVQNDSMLGTGMSGKIYQSMMIDQYSKSMGDKDVLGLSSEIKSSMLKMQEVKQKSKG